MNLSNAGGSRKSLAVFSIICILLMCFAAVLPADASGSMTLTASEIRAEKGNTIEVDFNLKENTGIWGLKFKVGYDHSVLTLASVENGSIFSDEDITLPESLDKEKYVFLACSSQLKNITENGTVVTLKFTIAEDAELKPYPITVSVIQVIDVAGRDLSIGTEDGSVEVVENAFHGGQTKPESISNEAKPVKSSKNDSEESDVDNGRMDTENEEEKNVEKDEDTKLIDAVKEDQTGKDQTSGDQTEKSKSIIGTVLIILAVIAAVCAAAALIIPVFKKRRKKQCKRKRRSKK